MPCKVVCMLYHEYSNIVRNRLVLRRYSNTSTIVEAIIKMQQRPIDRHIQEAQKQRKVIKERGSKYSPSVVTLQVLGSGARGCPKSVFVFTDQSRYLFNCGEGTQRLAHEHKMKLARLEHIFFTSASWGNMGGLPGVALTLQDTGVPKITLHGPPDLVGVFHCFHTVACPHALSFVSCTQDESIMSLLRNHNEYIDYNNSDNKASDSIAEDELFKATRRFVILKDMKIEMADCSPENVYDDSVMTMKYVPLSKNCTSASDSTMDVNVSSLSNIEADNTDYYAHQTSGRRDLQNTNVSDLLNAPTKEQLCAMAYICRIKPCLGTLDLQKCVSRGVKPGPSLGLLKNGQDVTLPDGTVVYAKDVRTPDDPGPIFLVIDVPHMDFLESLVMCEEFAIHQEHENMNMEDNPSVIIHFTPQEIFNTEKYQNFMNKFGNETKHLIVNDSNSCPGSIAIPKVQSKLNLLDNKIFPTLKTHLITSENTSHGVIDAMATKVNAVSNEQLLKHLKFVMNSSENNFICESDDAARIIPARTFTAFYLRPKKGLDRSLELKSNILEYVGETLTYPGFLESLENVYCTKPRLKCSNQQKYPRITFFGTGSCIPNKTRNTSCTMIHLNEESNLILDCGEGSFGQMARYYGNEEIINVMKNLKAIYLSHLHADHHLGLIGILQGRREILKSLGIKDIQPVYLLAPKQIMSWLWLYHKRFERILQEIKLITNSSLCLNNSDFDKVAKDILDHVGLLSVETCPVRHCPNSFGISLTTKQSKKITYSGDTMPCKELVRIGKESDLLIHEATMEDALAGEAKYKMHSTVSQAVNIGREMKAKFTLLTHFSQRYARVPILPVEIEKSEKKDVGVAFDNMEVTLDDLHILPHFYPALKLMFAEHFEDLENKAMKRALKRERNHSPIVLNRQQSRSITSYEITKKPTPSNSPDSSKEDDENDNKNM